MVRYSLSLPAIRVHVNYVLSGRALVHKLRRWEEQY